MFSRALLNLRSMAKEFDALARRPGRPRGSRWDETGDRTILAVRANLTRTARSHGNREERAISSTAVSRAESRTTTPFETSRGRTIRMNAYVLSNEKNRIP